MLILKQKINLYIGQNMRNVHEQQEEYCLGYYIVAYIDLLGQKDYLKKMKNLPNSIQEEEILRENLKKTYGTINGFRKLFDNFFQAFIDAEDSSPNEIHRFFAKSQVKKHYFSDTVVLYAPLANHDGNFPLKNIFPIIDSVSKTYLMMLSKGYVFRGGIDIGTGCEFLDGEIYGNALYKAYELENQAQYPRVIVGETLIECINNYKSEIMTPWDSLINKIVDICLNYIHKDSHDNKFIIFPNGYTGYEEEIQQWKNAAIDFANNEIRRFSIEKNTKLEERYTLLERLLTSLPSSKKNNFPSN